jgi:hypothetical protein
LGSSGFRSLDRHSLDPGDFRVQDRGFERLEQRQNRPRREQRAIESQRLAVVIPNAALRADGGHSRDARTFRISVEWLAAQSERGQAVDVDEKELKCSTPIGAPTRPKQSAQEKGATTSFTASAYWKFESTPLQRRVRHELGNRLKKGPQRCVRCLADSVQTALADTMRPAVRVATGWTTPIRTGVGGECRR